ncbi:MAG: DUF4238 domain-containing protein [Filimonas sp.]|nr:DUF4238 domain-containing protein [Filimonas sp.]
MPQYKNNHTVPCCVLRQWETVKDNRSGVFQYDIQKDKINFSESRGSGKFSFASSNYLYVPSVRNTRVADVELWLQEGETVLAVALQKWKREIEGPLFESARQEQKFRRSLFALRHRAQPALEACARSFLNTTHRLREFNFDLSRDLQLLVLENMVNATLHDTHCFSSYRTMLFIDPTASLMIGDSPFLGDIFGNDSFVSCLSPRFFIIIIKGEGVPEFGYTDLPGEFVRVFNKMVAEHSRQWIVARTEAILQDNIPFAKKPKQDDTPNVELREYLFKPFRFND